MITQAELKEQLDYNPETGVFTWKVANSNRNKVGGVAGCLHKFTGYNVIRINKKGCKSHRLAWLYVYGEFPKGFIDHINSKRLYLGSFDTEQQAHERYLKELKELENESK